MSRCRVSSTGRGLGVCALVLSLAWAASAWAGHIEVGDWFCRPALPTQQQTVPEPAVVYKVLAIQERDGISWFYVEFVNQVEMIRQAWVVMLEDEFGRLYIGDGSVFLLVARCRDA